MNPSQVYDKLTTPKLPPREVTPEEGLAAQQKAYEEQERTKWVGSIYTQRLLLQLKALMENQLEGALANAHTAGNLVENNEIGARRLIKYNTLKEITNYVNTGKI